MASKNGEMCLLRECFKAEVKFLKQKLSRGEICVANSIPPSNGVSLGSYFCVKNLFDFCLKTMHPFTPFIEAMKVFFLGF